MFFTPDPQEYPQSKFTRGTLNLNSQNLRCLRVRPQGRGRDYSRVEYDQIHFLAIHTAFKNVIERHGPPLFVDNHNRCVYFRESGSVSLDDYLENTDWNSSQDIDDAAEVIANTLDIIDALRNDGFCCPSGSSTYRVSNDFSVVQVDFEDLRVALPGEDCPDRISFEENIEDVLKNIILDNPDYGGDDGDDGYDYIQEIMVTLFP